MAEYALQKVPKGNYVMVYGASTDNNAHIMKKAQLDVLQPAIDRDDIKIVVADPLAAALEGMPSPVILLDAFRRVLYFNSLASDHWPALRQGNHISSYIRDPGVLRALENAHSSMRPRLMVAYEQRVPIERHMEATISWIGPAAGRAPERGPAILIFLRDLTEQERLDRLRSDFIANASHELRTPLASVLGFIETLQGAARNETPPGSGSWRSWPGRRKEWRG